MPSNALECNNSNCKVNLTDINTFHNNILNSCLVSGQKVLPVTGQKSSNKQKAKAGWNEYVKDKREVALFWHETWKNEGRPHNSYSAIMRCKTRLQYHYAIKCIEKNENIIKSNNMADRFIKKPQKAWKDCAKLRGKSNNIPNMVDNTTGEENISKLFASKFYYLLNSVVYDMTTLESKL